MCITYGPRVGGRWARSCRWYRSPWPGCPGRNHGSAPKGRRIRKSRWRSGSSCTCRWESSFFPRACRRTSTRPWHRDLKLVKNKDSVYCQKTLFSSFLSFSSFVELAVNILRREIIGIFCENLYIDAYVLTWLPVDVFGFEIFRLQNGNGQRVLRW